VVDRLKLETSQSTRRGDEEVEVHGEPDHVDLGEGDSGLPVGEICRKHGISSSAYYQWRSKFAGMSVAELKRVKELEAENARLQRMYADLALENAAIKVSPASE
jgi:putative transposase